MQPSVSHRALGALALSLLLAGCGGGGGGGEQNGASALASLDTRLTNGVVTGNAAAPAKPTAADAPKPDDRAARQKAGAPRAALRLAATQGRAVGGCAGPDLRYGAQWADRMPEGLGVTPGATLVEAAGSDTDRCALRVISFTTADSPETIAVRYARRARNAGFDAERLPCRDEIRMGGTRAGDDAAYLFFARRKGKVTEVDVIASSAARVS